tara:strand:- start:2296 stop:3195 length:900 start_codon:yes stop_codon:yes gene_type:complete
MISALILSKDRPCQLHLLLESIQRNTSNLFDITVVYDANGEEMENGYDFTKRYFHFKNKSGHTFPIKWKRRQSESITLEILSCLSTGRNLTCLLNDSNVFINEPSSYKDITNLFETQLLSTLSLRLGNNTIIQNPYDASGYFIDKPQEGNFLYDKYMVWDPTKIEPYTNFAMPFSINGHVYYTDFLAHSILDVEMEDFQDFETLMQKKLYSGFIKDVPILMASLEYSSVIHNSNKKVSDEEKSELGVSLEDINERYLAGMIIDYEHFDFTHISKPFQDFILKFKHEDYMHYSYTGSQAG